jgi:glucose-6-phosphate-specific signal transduction histidine kinase
VAIQIEDDGIGIPGDLDLAGQGGLALHSTMLALLGGTMALRPVDPTGTRVEINLPIRRDGSR